MTTDFTDDMAALGVAHYAAAERRAGLPLEPSEARPPRPMKGALKNFFEPGVLPSDVKPANGPIGHPCNRCSSNADREEREGRPRPPVLQAESYVGWAGRRVWLGTCRTCTDIEFTQRWNGRRALAQREGNAIALAKLEKERQHWLSKGRRYLG